MISIKVKPDYMFKMGVVNPLNDRYFELMSVEDLPDECWKDILNLADEYMATLS